jgi:hypothetical protein
MLARHAAFWSIRPGYQPRIHLGSLITSLAKRLLFDYLLQATFTCRFQYKIQTQLKPPVSLYHVIMFKTSHYESEQSIVGKG